MLSKCFHDVLQVNMVQRMGKAHMEAGVEPSDRMEGCTHTSVGYAMGRRHGFGLAFLST